MVFVFFILKSWPNYSYKCTIIINTYKNNYSFNRMLIKVNRSEIKIKQKIEDKNRWKCWKWIGFAKTFNIQNQRNYDVSPTPFNKVLQNLHWHIYCTHFLIAFLKLLRDCKNFISSGSWLHIFGPKKDTFSFPWKILGYGNSEFETGKFYS